MPISQRIRRLGTVLTLVALGALALAAYRAAADDIRPATPLPVPATTARAAPALQADALLNGFPHNASVLAARSDAKSMTIEGRVRDVRRVTVHGGDTEVHVILVGKSQADDTPAHFTCHIAANSADAALALKPDMVVRLTGSIGPVLPAQDRIDLLNCHDLSDPTALTLAEKIIGRWNADVPAGSAQGSGTGTATRVEIAFAPDNTFTQEAFNGTQSVRKITGRWQVKGKEDGPQTLHFLPQNHPDSDTPIHISDDGQFTFTPTGLSTLNVREVTAKPVAGTKFDYESRAMKEQVIRWLAANLSPAAQSQMLTSLSTSIDNASNDWYSIEMGSGMLTAKRPSQLLVFDARMFVLPYSAPQATHAGLDPPDVRFTTIHPNAMTLMEPEAKVESLTLDGKGLATGKDLTGKVAFRILGKPLNADYSLLMSSLHGSLTAHFDRAPGPDVDTFSFSFEGSRLTNAYTNRDPLPLIFAIGRQDKSGDRSMRIVSEPTAQLVDVIRN